MGPSPLHNPVLPDHQDLPPTGLVADWVTIWQSELAAIAVDREQAEHAAAILAAWLAASNAVRHHERPASERSARARSGPADAGTDAAARPTPAAAAPAAGDALAELEGRMAELERRLDAVVSPVRPD